MNTARKIMAFPFEALLFVCVAAYVAIELVCLLVGQVCRLIDGCDE